MVPGAIDAPTPLDSTLVYLTPELLGVDVSPREVQAALAEFSVADAAVFVGQLLARYEAEGADFKALDREYCENWFTPEARPRAQTLLRSGHRLFAPQALLVLIKLALDGAGEQSSANAQARGVAMVRALLGVSQYLGATPEREKEAASSAAGLKDELILELVSNYYFNASMSAASVLAHHQRMWLEIAPALHDEESGRWVDFAGEFEKATGIPLSVFHAVGVGVWTRARSGVPIVSVDWFSTTDTDAALVASSLELLSTSADGWVAAFDEEARRNDFPGTRWDFSAFERFPLLRLPDDDSGVQHYAVVSPRFLLRRVFGPPAYFDVEASLRAAGRPKDVDRLRNLRGEVVERYVLETLTGMPGALGSPTAMVSEKELQQLLGTKQKVCDAVLTTKGRVVLLDAASRKLARPAVTGRSVADLDKEIDSLIVKKARQFESTRQLLLDSWDKVFPGSPRPVRFYPTVVVDDDWPVNPITTGRISERLKDEGLLQHPDTARLEILDLDELDGLEALAERGQLSLVEALEKKEHAALRDMPMVNFVVQELHLRVPRPRRLDPIWTGVMDRALQELGLTPP